MQKSKWKNLCKILIYKYLKRKVRDTKFEPTTSLSPNSARYRLRYTKKSSSPSFKSSTN